MGSIAGSGMSSTDPCNIAGTNPNKAACAASGKMQDSNMCNILNAGASLSACSAQAQQAASAGISNAFSFGKFIGYAILVIVIIIGIVVAIGMFKGNGNPVENTVVGGAKFAGAHFSRMLKKLLPKRK